MMPERPHVTESWPPRPPEPPDLPQPVPLAPGITIRSMMEDLRAENKALRDALQDIADGRVLVMDDIGQTFAGALREAARAVLKEVDDAKAK